MVVFQIFRTFKSGQVFVRSGSSEIKSDFLNWLIVFWSAFWFAKVLIGQSSLLRQSLFMVKQGFQNRRQGFQSGFGVFKIRQLFASQKHCQKFCSV